MFPKPPRKEKKPRKPIQRTRVRTRRTKARRGRLKGEDIARLRAACFDRDGFRCVDCGSIRDLQMAHIRGKRRHGDSLSNVRTKCFECHIVKEHQYGPTGLKPVPAKKERAQ